MVTVHYWFITETRICNLAKHVFCSVWLGASCWISAYEVFWYMYLSRFSCLCLFTVPVTLTIIKYLRALSWIALLWKKKRLWWFLPKKEVCLVGKLFSKRYKIKLSLASPWYELWPRIQCLWKQHFLWHSTVWFSAVTLAIASITGN